MPCGSEDMKRYDIQMNFRMTAGFAINIRVILLQARWPESGYVSLQESADIKKKF